MSNIVQFNSQQIELINRNNQPFITQIQLGRALGYTRGDVVGQLYKAHSDEFTPDMTCTSDLLVQGQKRKVRVFSLRGCHLLAMFSKTPVAKEFRKWVLDLIESHNQAVSQKQVSSLAQIDVNEIVDAIVEERAKKICEDRFKVVTKELNQVLEKNLSYSSAKIKLFIEEEARKAFAPQIKKTTTA